MFAKLILTLLILSGFSFAVCSGGGVKSRGDETTVSPHQKINPLLQGNWIIKGAYGTEEMHIGMTKDQLIETLGKPLNESPYLDYCDYSHMQWIKSNPDGTIEPGNGIISYLRNNTVYEIEFSNPRFATDHKMSYGAKWDDLLKILDKKDVFTLTRSSSNATNDENLLYGIDREHGLAYQSGKNAEGKRNITSVYVFAPANGFHPRSCMSRDQEFVPVK